MAAARERVARVRRPVVAVGEAQAREAGRAADPAAVVGRLRDRAARRQRRVGVQARDDARLPRRDRVRGVLQHRPGAGAVGAHRADERQVLEAERQLQHRRHLRRVVGVDQQAVDVVPSRARRRRARARAPRPRSPWPCARRPCPSRSCRGRRSRSAPSCRHRPAGSGSSSTPAANSASISASVKPEHRGADLARVLAVLRRGGDADRRDRARAERAPAPSGRCRGPAGPAPVPSPRERRCGSARGRRGASSSPPARPPPAAAPSPRAAAASASSRSAGGRAAHGRRCARGGGERGRPPGSPRTRRSARHWASSRP